MAKPLPKHLRRISNSLDRGRMVPPVHMDTPVGTSGTRRGLSRNQKIGIGVGVGAATAGLVALRRSQKVEKAAYSQDGTNVLRLTARTPSGRFVSHENDLHVTHITPKRRIDSKVLVARKGRGDTKAHVEKSLPIGATTRGRGVGRKLTG